MICGCPGLFAYCTFYHNLYKQIRSPECTALRQDSRAQTHAHPSPRGRLRPRWGRGNVPIRVSEGLLPLAFPRYLQHAFHWRQVSRSVWHSVVFPPVLMLLSLFSSWRTGLEVSQVGGAVVDLTCNCLSRTAVLLLWLTQVFSVPCRCFLRNKRVREICK